MNDLRVDQKIFSATKRCNEMQRNLDIAQAQLANAQAYLRGLVEAKDCLVEEKKGQDNTPE